MEFGIRANLSQFIHQLIQVFFVGMTLGLLRTVVPALSEAEFGVPRDSFMLLMMFVVAFGFVKGAMNFLAGRFSDQYGRRKVLLLGWISAIPIPFLLYFAENWNWIVFATVLLGVNQGLCWSMTQTAKLDITHGNQRGLTIGMNEFSGYIGVAIAGIITGYFATWFGNREGLLVFGSIIIAASILTTLLWVKETKAWADHEASLIADDHEHKHHAGASTLAIFKKITWQDRQMAAFNQAGLVEKFVDALIWVFYPVYFYQQGVSLANIGWIVGIYSFIWGGSQFLTGRLSDQIGRRWPVIVGMWLCGIGVMLTLAYPSITWWSISAAITGFGMALLYPNLSAAISDLAHPSWRGTAIGIYRFWRDTGYGIGALLLGMAAHFTGLLESGFWFVGISMIISGGLVLIWGKESHPRFRR